MSVSKGIEAADGPWTLKSMLVVPCLSRRIAGGPKCPCIREVEEGKSMGLRKLLVGLILPSAWVGVRTPRCWGIGEGDLDGRSLDLDEAGPGPNW